MFKGPGNPVFFFLFLFVVSCSTDPIAVDENPDGSGQIPDNRKLPQISINTNGLEIVDEPKIAATMTIMEEDKIDFSGRIGIEIRGSSSQMFPKKQFGVELWDASNEGIDASLLGFPEEEDWILQAPYSDKTLIRNVLMYDLSRSIGRYASRTRLVEVSINGAYNGVYVLMEKLKRDINRININKLNPDEIAGDAVTGGYILKIDKAYYTPDNSFNSYQAPYNSVNGQQIYFIYDTPKPEEINAEQRQYISNYVREFEEALAGDNFTDPVAGYSNYIDTSSFIDFFLLNEISNNVDGFRISTWITKDKNAKLNMGPIWDFNLAFGNANYCEGGLPFVWAYQFNSRCSEDWWQIPFWWERLLQDPAYVEQLKARWQELRAGAFATGVVLEKIDNYVALLTETNAVTQNFQRWPILSEYVWPNNFVGNTYEAEIGYMKDWIQARLTWMDGAIEGL
ncbi:MAG: hypothetical protein RLZZ241_2170 [Bacteroidota bacterium]